VAAPGNRALCSPAHSQPTVGKIRDHFNRALEVSGEATKKAAVTRALEEFIARRRQKKLLDLMGSLEWDSQYDYRAERSRK
jgi:hypothetical protein